MQKKEIVMMPLDSIKPYENNPRNNETAVDKVAESIKQFGFKNPIIVDKDNIIIAGHTRLKAAYKLGLEVAPVIVADDLDEEKAKAFRLADNKTSEFASWDFEKLEAELAELTGIDMESLGFTIDNEEIDIDGFFEDAEPKEKEPKMVTCPHCGEVFEV
jgi:ParB/RepB/Spo0J family partition protein